MNFRLRKAATSAEVRLNHSPFCRRRRNRLCQYSSIPAGSSVLIEWSTADFGAEGGLARAKALSPKARRDIARLAAETRWAAVGDNNGDGSGIYEREL